MMSEFSRSMPLDDRDLAVSGSLIEKLRLDIVLLFPIILIMALGLFVLFSASDGDWTTVLRQLRNLFFGLCMFFAAAQIPIDTLQRWSLMLFLGTLILLLLVPLVGVNVNGAQRWLSLGLFRFQPSEVMKVAMPLTVSVWISRSSLPPALSITLAALLLITIPSALIMLQPDLGTAILIAASGLFVVFMSGVSWWQITATLTMVILCMWPAWLFLLRDYQKQRIITLFNPEADKLGAGWNIIQSKTAIGSGGWSGKGWLEGTQSHLSFLPESQTDFIIAVLAEEWGLRGVLLLLALYAMVAARGLWISLRSGRAFARLASAAITLTFCVYIVVNMGMVAGLLPVVGVPLPFISYGGTSVVTLMLGFGILSAMSMERRVIA